MCFQIGFESFSPGAPASFLDLVRHARVFASTLLIFSAAGTIIATAILRSKAWGWRAMAWLFTGAAVIAAAIRIVMPARWVMDPTWLLVLALSIFAVSSWQRARSAR